MYRIVLIIFCIFIFITSCQKVTEIEETESVPAIAVVSESEDEIGTVTAAPVETESTTVEDTTAPITTVPETTTKLPETTSEIKNPKYVSVPKFLDYNEEDAIKLFEDYGFKCSVIYEYSEYNKGIVFLFSYRGHEEADNYYIAAGTEITLHVSLGEYVFKYVNAKATKETEKVIYLTFDDGPSGKVTDRVLEILDKFGIKATFFTVGQFVSYYPNKVKTIYEAGHVIGCHSYSHKYPDIYSSTDAIIADLREWEKQIEKALGEKLPYKLYRFPGGVKNNFLDISLRPYFIEAIYNEGYKIFDWNSVTNDALNIKLKDGQTMGDYLEESLLSTLTSTAKYPSVPKIVLMHDTKEHTADNLERMIQYLIDNGYSFGTLDQLDSGWINH